MTTTRYRKKPVEIEATQWDGTAEGATQVIEWILANGGTATYTCSDPDRCAETEGDTPHSIGIRTLEGTMQADLDDWIIREPFPTDDRRFYPCKPGIFTATYEVAEPGTASAEQRAEAASRLGTRYMVRAERAEATIERVRRAVHDSSSSASPVRTGKTLAGQLAARVLAALDGTPRPAATEATEAAAPALRQQLRAAIEPTLLEHPEHNRTDEHEGILSAIITAVLSVVLPHGKFLGDQLRQPEADMQRVTALYEQWVKAGPPPLGVPLARWWDARLAELHNAILPPTDHA